PAPRRASGVRSDRRPPCDGPLRRGGRAALRPRGRRPPQRARQGRRLGVLRRAAAARRQAPLRQRPALVRARAEGGRRGLPAPRRRRRAVVARDRARRRPRPHALRLRPRRAAERLHRGVADRQLTGVLLVGGASRRFGAPKALAELDGETLAARAWRLLGEVCDERLAVGKRADGLELPFPLLDDGSEVRAALAGLVAGLRAASHDLAVV